MDLVDALSSNTTAKTAVELILNPHFRRHYSALNKAVAVSLLTNRQLADLASQNVSAPSKRKFHLLGTDVTSNPRPFANTLPDRGFVYQPNTIKGNKPIAIGHQYSFWALLPEYDPSKKSNWVVPLSMQRVSSQENKEMVGAKQLAELLADEELALWGSLMCGSGRQRLQQTSLPERQSAQPESGHDCAGEGNTHFLSSACTQRCTLLRKDIRLGMENPSA